MADNTPSSKPLLGSTIAGQHIHLDEQEGLGVFWDAALRSGMREVRCSCGTIFLTRSESDLCPPCRGIVPKK